MQKLADVAGVARSNVWRWERGEGGPQARQLLKILRHYREQADYLVNGTPGEEPEPEEYSAALAEFLKTPLGIAIEAASLTSVLSSIQFKDTPSVLRYHDIALALLRRDE